MALVLADRVQQTGTANTTVSFTLSGSVTGYQSFAVIGNTNTTYYAATDTSGNWETGVGTYSTTGPTLTRTTILSSSNSGSAVTFSGTVNIFVTYPAERSVYSNGTNIVPDNTATLLATSGGTGQSSYAVGDLVYADTTTSLAKLADVATGNALISGGVGVAPNYGKIGLTTHVSGTLPVANGGTNQTTYTNGQLLIGNTTGNTLTKATLTAGSGISITNGTGSITIATATADVQTFTGSGTWTKPSTGQFVRIQMWGGGGGGSRANTIIFGAGGGGGYYETTIPIASMGATATVTVGGAGTGRTATTGVGTDGGNSAVTLGSGSIIYVSGGKGAANDSLGGAGGYGALTFTTTALADPNTGIGNGASTGVVAGNGYSYTGGGGAFATTNLTGGSGGWGAGGGSRGTTAGGTSIFGGAGGNANGAGVQPGGGGGCGAAANTNATNGGAGQVIITTF